jgi:hypothetical protein
MTRSQQIPNAPVKALNQNNLKPDDPRDKPVGAKRTPLEKPPKHDLQDQERIEELGEEGVASKE